MHNAEVQRGKSGQGVDGTWWFCSERLSGKTPLHCSWTPQIYGALSDFLTLEHIVPSVHDAIPLLFVCLFFRGSSSRKFLSLGRPDAPLPSGHAKQEEVCLSSQMEQRALWREW